ncbi:MAG: CHASE domain-containing protein, partial [bacterium]
MYMEKKVDLKNKNQDTQKLPWWKKYIPLIFIMTAGVIFSLVVFIVMRQEEYEGMKMTFDLAAEERAVGIEKSVADQMIVLEAVHSFFYEADSVSRDEFKGFVKPFFKHVEGIQALEWIPWVLDEERAKYENKAREDGLAGFSIREIIPQGDMVSAGKRSEYFPVYFVEPYQGNEASAGFDLASNPVRLSALNEARSTGKSIATERIKLVQEKREQYGFLLFMPVFKKGMAVNTVEERKNSLVGFVLGVFRI